MFGDYYIKDFHLLTAQLYLVLKQCKGTIYLK